jgi:hypothetical protein
VADPNAGDVRDKVAEDWGHGVGAFLVAVAVKRVVSPQLSLFSIIMQLALEHRAAGRSPRCVSPTFVGAYLGISKGTTKPVGGDKRPQLPCGAR